MRKSFHFMRKIFQHSNISSIPIIYIKHHPHSEEKDMSLKDTFSLRRMIGKLLYLTITRPDISYVVSFLSHILSKPFISHFQSRIKILKYILKMPLAREFYIEGMIPLLLMHIVMQIGHTAHLLEDPSQVFVS